MNFMMEFVRNLVAVVALVVGFLSFLAVLMLPVFLADIGYFWEGGALLLVYILVGVAWFTAAERKERKS